MRSPCIMVALPAPGVIGPIEMGKVSRLALALDAEVELFHCIYDAEVARPGLFASLGTQENIHEFVERRRQQLEVLAARMRAGGVRVRTSVRWDYPTYEGIVRQVLRHKPSLLIAHPTRRGRTARRLLGRTDFKLIETCPCPVLFIKTWRPYADVVVLAAVDPGHAHSKPPALDAEILGWACRVRDALSARLLVFHARVPRQQALQAEPKLREAPEAVRADVGGVWHDSVEAGILALAQEYSVPRQRVHIADGSATDTLPPFAQQVKADIVVMGGVARARIGRLLIGHTAERVLDALESDVLVVKPPGFRSSVSPQSTHHVERSSARAARTIWL
jgi:universal stress protein E